MEKNPSKVDVEHECWKRFVNIFSNTKYCGICLETKNELCELEAEFFQIFATSEADALNLKEILYMLFGNSAQNLIHSGFICTTCKDSAINSYIFIHHTKQNADIFDHYLKQLDSKIDRVYEHCLNQMSEQKSENALIVIEKPVKTVPFGSNMYNQSKIWNNFRIINDDNTVDDDQSTNISDTNINTDSLVSTRRKQNVKKRGDGNLSCNICHKLFREKRNLQIHKLKQHLFASKKRDYTCLVCQFKCVDTTGLRAHMLIHDADKKYACDICSLDFDSRQQYLQHVRGLQHQAKVNPKILEHYKIKRRNLYCSVCDIKMSNNKAFVEHMNTHGPDEIHKCIQCDMEFDSRRLYLAHTRTVQHFRMSGVRQKIKCKYCEYAAYQARNLKIHFQRRHLEMRLYECFICKKKLMTEITLQKHIERHSAIRDDTEKKDYRKECGVCGRVLAGHTAMKKHMRRHTGERPYLCDLCDMGFICKSELTMHIYRKHMEKSVACPLCRVKFHTIANMRNHVKKVHWKSDEKFDYRKLEGLSEADYRLFQDRRKIEFAFT